MTHCHTCNGPCARPCTLNCGYHLPPTQLRTCIICTGQTRAKLQRVVDLHAQLPAFIGQLEARPLGFNPATDEEPLPGGNALVLAGPGSEGLERFRAFMRGEDPNWDQDDRTGDPDSIAAELGRWEDDWRKQRRHPAARKPPTVKAASTYLGVNHHWAAQNHEAFPEYAETLTNLIRHLELATHTSDQPQRAEATCQECPGVWLIREWTDHGLNLETAKCPVCHTTYDAGQIWVAMHAQLEAATA